MYLAASASGALGFGAVGRRCGAACVPDKKVWFCCKKRPFCWKKKKTFYCLLVINRFHNIYWQKFSTYLITQIHPKIFSVGTVEFVAELLNHFLHFTLDGFRVDRDAL